jgi:DNA-binding MarR family transcriptional regulator
VTEPALGKLDRLIHEPARLGIVSVLASRPALPFTELRDLLGMTDGNLSVHLRALEEAGYVAVEKSFVGRRPRTTLSLTKSGRVAFARHVDALEAILRGAGDVGQPKEST